MSEYIYSIVIPHYNSATLLQRMLDSIPQRKDIQIIVVDDCSTIENIELLRNSHHSNLEITYLPDNHGPGHARNVGMQMATGKWLLVVDADDVFADHAFSVFDNYVDSDYDYINYCIKVTNADLKTNGNNVYSDQIVREYIENPTDTNLLKFKYLNSVCWNKLVRNKFIQANGVCFDETMVTDDIIYNLIIGLKAKKFKVIPDELYVYIENMNSITHKNKTLDREFLFYIQIQKRNGFFQKLGLTHYPFYRRTILYFPHMLLKRGLSDAIKFFKMIRERKNEIAEARKAYLYLFQ
ncbi:MAG: glycosyltransferase [Bacteroidales bacterium]|nr:glycosyltransferase [Bacteroidales bacterium]